MIRLIDIRTVPVMLLRFSSEENDMSFLKTPLIKKIRPCNMNMDPKRYAALLIEVKYFK